METIISIVVNVAEFVVDVLDKKRIEEFRKHIEEEKKFRSPDQYIPPTQIDIDQDLDNLD